MSFVLDNSVGSPGVGLSAYDAAYLELALRRDLPLATLDRDLEEAARAENVPLLDRE